tara:strand:+ start:940 stop:1353 length:414 start_codon:yes stop_codon:yes gene_type:complete
MNEVSIGSPIGRSMRGVTDQSELEKIEIGAACAANSASVGISDTAMPSSVDTGESEAVVSDGATLFAWDGNGMKMSRAKINVNIYENARVATISKFASHKEKLVYNTLLKYGVSNFVPMTRALGGLLLTNMLPLVGC